ALATVASAILAACLPVPARRAAVVAAIPPLVLLAATHLTVVLTRPADHNTEPTPAASVELPALDAAETTEPQPEEAPTEPVEDAESRPPLRLTPPETSSGGTRPDVSEGSGRRVRAEGVRRLGWCDMRLAREVGVDQSTVSR